MGMGVVHRLGRGLSPLARYGGGARFHAEPRTAEAFGSPITPRPLPPHVRSQVFCRLLRRATPVMRPLAHSHLRPMPSEAFPAGSLFQTGAALPLQTKPPAGDRSPRPITIPWSPWLVYGSLHAGFRILPCKKQTNSHGLSPQRKPHVLPSALLCSHTLQKFQAAGHSDGRSYQPAPPVESRLLTYLWPGCGLDTPRPQGHGPSGAVPGPGPSGAAASGASGAGAGGPPVPSACWREDREGGWAARQLVQAFKTWLSLVG